MPHSPSIQLDTVKGLEIFLFRKNLTKISENYRENKNVCKTKFLKIAWKLAYFRMIIAKIEKLIFVSTLVVTQTGFIILEVHDLDRAGSTLNY
jgi:hypothetical protein